MPMFKTKPVTIEAMQFTADRADTGDLLGWADGAASYVAKDEKEWLEIATLEGVMRADIGDWIIKGLRGEFYPCKPDIFAMKYEAAQ